MIHTLHEAQGLRRHAVRCGWMYYKVSFLGINKTVLGSDRDNKWHTKSNCSFGRSSLQVILQVQVQQDRSQGRDSPIVKHYS
jgi:hypothetical protein